MDALLWPGVMESSVVAKEVAVKEVDVAAWIGDGFPSGSPSLEAAGLL